jgi:hypothetical protein
MWESGYIHQISIALAPVEVIPESQHVATLTAIENLLHPLPSVPPDAYLAPEPVWVYWREENTCYHREKNCEPLAL